MTRRDPTQPPANAFAPDFLSRLRQRDEPATAAEGDAAGPWRVAELADGRFGVFRAWEGPERGDPPAVVTRDRPAGLLVAAVLPGVGRDPRWRLRSEPSEGGFALELGGEVVAHARHFLPELAQALDVLDALARSPEGLGRLLEAVGYGVLDHAGRALVRSVAGEGNGS